MFKLLLTTLILINLQFINFVKSEKGLSTTCAGHGYFDILLNSCVCFTDEYRGYWEKTIVEHTSSNYVKIDGIYVKKNIKHQITTCITCLYGYETSDGCLSGFLSPSKTPTRSPTLSPTRSPTKSPNISPTLSPSQSPSQSPSVSPYQPPSSSPSQSPTRSPSSSPSLNPSQSPSTSPSQTPSISPSMSPSVSPSQTPSMSPSMSPSQTPSVSPSASPSSSPHVSPSASPSQTPSISPSMSPYSSPSASPSSGPSLSPSESPSLNPSQSPSFNPSQSPSQSPSLNPSQSPSISPSISPSQSPSISPSISPSQSPSISPSISPSQSPSFNPSQSPSQSPSKSPSQSPSQSPTVSPTTTPIVLFRSIGTVSGGSVGAYDCEAEALSGDTTLGGAVSREALCGTSVSARYAKVVTSASIPHLSTIEDQGGIHILPNRDVHTVHGVYLGTWQELIDNGPLIDTINGFQSLEDYNVLPPLTRVWTGAAYEGGFFVLACGITDEWEDDSGNALVAPSSGRGSSALGGTYEGDCSSQHYILCTCWDENTPAQTSSPSQSPSI